MLFDISNNLFVYSVFLFISSALVFFIIATSVVNINDLSLFPKILIPDALDIMLGIDT